MPSPRFLNLFLVIHANFMSNPCNNIISITTTFSPLRILLKTLLKTKAPPSPGQPQTELSRARKTPEPCPFKPKCNCGTPNAGRWWTPAPAPAPSPSPSSRARTEPSLRRTPAERRSRRSTSSASTARRCPTTRARTVTPTFFRRVGRAVGPAVPEAVPGRATARTM